VWTPGIDDARRPVLVWIHGGGFLTGSGNLAFYAADTFARDGDAVAISINYRLGPLGFMSGVGDANVWLTDQVAALRWVAANAAAFGGDPARIALAGQSGGAFSIAALAQHPDTRGLFQRGILQSPPLGLDLPAAEDAVERARSLARHLGHTDLAALHHESWERLIGGTIGVLGEYAKFGEWALAFLPVIDQATLPPSSRTCRPRSSSASPASSTTPGSGSSATAIPTARAPRPGRPYTSDDHAVLVVGDDNIRVETDRVKALSASL